jgi:phospholipid/cholesterol/gamma-HCH transport system substrate-binding protein
MEKMLADLHSVLLPVVRKAGDGLDEWTRLGGEMRTNSEQLRGLIAQLRNLAVNVEQGKGTVGRLLTDTSLADGAEKLLARASETLGETREAVTNLSVAANNLQRGTTRLPEITDAVANEAKDLPGLVRQTQISMRELERLVEALQQNWLARKHVNKTNPPPLRPAPEREEPARQPVKILNSPKAFPN